MVALLAPRVSKSQITNHTSSGLRLLRVVFEVDIQPDRPRQAENVYEEDGADGDQGAEGGGSAPTQYPVQEQHEQDAEPCGKNVGDEHGPEVKPGLRHKVLAAVGAGILHVERLVEAEGTRVKKVFFVALRAFQAEDAVGF